MKITYLILAYKFPEQLVRLVSALNAPNCDFLIHVDRKVELSHFSASFQNFNNVAFVEPRIESHWGHVALIQAILLLIQRASSAGYYFLLTDQHYPLVSNADISSFLLSNPYDAFFGDKDSLADTDWKERTDEYTFFIEPKDRYLKTIQFIGSRKFYRLSTIRKLWEISVKTTPKNLGVIFKKRKSPMLTHFGGAWWAMSSDLAKDVARWLDENPSFLSYHIHSLIPEEMVFHTVVNEVFQARVEPKSLTYVRWVKGTPHTFDHHDFEELQTMSNKYLFARKFDTLVSPQILDKLDMIIKKTK